ncbi:MAG: peptide-methionine (S)-S-oxide reductase MsrA [Aquabacterium sp.]
MDDESSVIEVPLSPQDATFGAGCFWCVEAVFQQIQGVLHVESGYCNGSHPEPTYDIVCTGKSGHAEVVRVQYDEHVVTYDQLLRVFFSIHDPTSLNRQGADAGTQYRSGVYTHNEKQQEAAERMIRELAKFEVYKRPVVTEVKPISNYHKAEDYHQRYFEQHPDQGYCAMVVAPKVAKFQAEFSQLLKKSDA